MQQYVQSNRRIWQGALPKAFRNYYLELENDWKNAYRSERVNKLMNNNLVRKIENFLDVVVQSNQKNSSKFGTFKFKYLKRRNF
jgi:hypothetical protein